MKRTYMKPESYVKTTGGEFLQCQSLTLTNDPYNNAGRSKERTNSFVIDSQESTTPTGFGSDSGPWESLW